MTFVTILNRTLPIYSIMGIAGIIAAIAALFFICRYLKRDYENVLTFLMITIVGAMLGSKLLFLFISIRDIMSDMEKISEDFRFFIDKYIYGGMVFYGALIGGIITSVLYCRIRKLNFKDYALPVITVVPLIHSIARIGCYIVGCCYGKPTDLPIGVVYHASIAAPPDILLFPVQLVESACNMIIFAVLLTVLRKKDAFFSIGLYACMYSVIRFTLEFFRGDIIRGFVGVLSTSQFISIFLFIFGLCFFYLYGKQKN